MIKKISTSIILLSAVLLLISWAMPNNKDWQQKVSPTLLQKAKTQQTVEFLVQLEAQANVSAAKSLSTKTARSQYVFDQLKATAEQSQAPLLRILKTAHVEYKAFYVVNAIYVKGNIDLIQQLAEQVAVAYIQDNPTAKVEEVAEENFIDLRGPNAIEWGIEMINADDVWAMGYTGQDITVAGGDTGYDWTHPALQSKYRGWNGEGVPAEHAYNWHDAIHEISPLHGDTLPDPSLNPCGLNSLVPCDDHNHGTHTMGTMVGEDGENQIGVAPGAKWMACRNMERGYGSPATYIECFEFFLAPTDLNNENPDPLKSPHVIANSWSCPEMEGCNPDNWAVMETVVNNLKASGVVVVVSAGNSGNQGCSSVSTPAAIFENSFTIGATSSEDLIAGFSSRGPVTVDGSMRMKPNVSAPGVGVRSSIRNGGYASFSGTSMAGPHVAGLVALVISANPALAGQVEILEEIIEASAIEKVDEQCGSADNAEIPNNVYGHGRVDALAAVEMALTFTDVEETLVLGEQVNIYPNPATNTVTFETSELVGQTNLEIFDVQGRLIKTATWNLNKQDTNSLSLVTYAKGVYFYKIINGQQVLQGKLVKE